jgi:hypothetical protein
LIKSRFKCKTPGPRESDGKVIDDANSYRKSSNMDRDVLDV